MYLVVLYIFIRWKGRVTIIVTITFLRIIAKGRNIPMFKYQIFESRLDQYWKKYEGKFNFTSTYSRTVDRGLECAETNQCRESCRRARNIGLRLLPECYSVRSCTTNKLTPVVITRASWRTRWLSEIRSLLLILVCPFSAACSLAIRLRHGD